MRTKHYLILSVAIIQGGGKTLKNEILRKRFAFGLGGLLFTSLVALSPLPLQAECPRGWDASGNWGLKQSNQNAPNSMQLQMDRQGQLTGSASYPTGAGGSQMTGEVKGRIIVTPGKDGLDTFVQLEVSWRNNLTGIYKGRVGPDGTITGTGWEKNSPSAKVSWSSDKVMKCIESR